MHISYSTHSGMSRGYSERERDAIFRGANGLPDDSVRAPRAPPDVTSEVLEESVENEVAVEVRPPAETEMPAGPDDMVVERVVPEPEPGSSPGKNGMNEVRVLEGAEVLFVKVRVLTPVVWGKPVITSVMGSSDASTSHLPRWGAPPLLHLIPMMSRDWPLHDDDERHA